MKQKVVFILNSQLFIIAALALILCYAGSASATNGYFAHGYSIKNKALGGASTALPLDALAAASNPAGMAFLDTRIDIGITVFNPNREYTINGNPTTGLIPGVSCNFPGAPPVVGPPCPFGLMPGTVDSDSEWFVIPSIGVNWMIDKNSSLGLSIFGNGGMNTDYDTNTFNVSPMLPSFGSMPTGVDLSQLFIVPTYSRKLHPKHAIGISPIIAYQSFEAQGMQIFGEMGFSTDPTKLSNNGHDNVFGYGGRIGYLGEILPGLFLGASYQTPIYMDKFSDYAGLFAEQGDFDIPQNWSAGLAFHATPELVLVFDVQQILYGDSDSIANPMNPAFNTCFGALLMGTPASATPECLGGNAGVGFGWEDMTVYKFGIQWQSSPQWTWRAGYSYGEQPIPDTEVMFNILAPGVIEQHATGGFTVATGDSQEFNFAAMHGFSNDVTGPNPLDPAQTITLEMDQWEFSAGYSWKFN